MPAAAAVATQISREQLESLLRSRKLDHTLTDAFPEPEGDASLAGFPRGHLSEVVGPRSSGRLSAAVSAMAEATRRGEAVALIDPLDCFDPASAAETDVDFSRVLWIRGEATSSARTSLSCEYGTLQKNVDRAVKALNLVLQAGGFGFVVVDLADVAPQVLRRLPFTTWLRLYRVIEGSETACLVIASEPIARSARGITVKLDRAAGSGLRATGTTEAWSPKSGAMEIPNVRVPVSA